MFRQAFRRHKTVLRLPLLASDRTHGFGAEIWVLDGWLLGDSFSGS
jgi:hypothetical protein